MDTQLSRTILMVEDNPEDREMYRRYLLRDRDCNYTIVEASLGEEGLKLWQQHQPDVVLLDYRLPDLDGLEFLAALQAQEVQRPLPIVMVTGSGSEKIAVQAIRAGAQDYLVKGQITPEGLKLALDATIKTVQLQAQLQERIDREIIIAQIAQKVFRSLDLDEILNTTVTEVRQFLQTDRVVVFQVEPNGNGKVVAESVGAAWRSVLLEKIYDPCFAQSYVDIYRQGRVTVKADIHDGSIEPCYVQLLDQLQVKANLVVPILHDEQFWGVLIAHHCATPRPWRSLEVDLLQQLSTQVSIAIRQAALYQQSQDELVEHKRTEEKLRISQERLMMGLQAARMGTWDWDIAGNQIIWSANMESLFGLAPGEFDGSYEQFVSRLHPEDRDRVLEAIDLAITSGANYDIEFRVLYPDGTIRWALSQGKAFYDATGKPIRMSGVDLDITSRKQAETSLRRSEEFNRRILDSNQDCIKVLDLEGRLLYINDGGKRLLEIDDFANYDRSLWTQFWGGNERDLAQAALKTAISGTIGKFEGQCPTMTGILKWWEVTVIPLHDGDENVEQILVISHNLTERRQMEDDLRQTQELAQRQLVELEAIYQTAPIGLTIFDADLRYVRINQRLAEMNGVSIEGHIGRTLREIIPDLANESEQLLHQVLETGQPRLNLEISGATIAQPGINRTWISNFYPLTDISGRSVGINVVVQEITDRKMAEAALSESEDRFRSTFEQAAVGIAHIGLEGEWLRVNQKLCDIVGYSESELLSMTFQSITHSDDLPTNLSHIQELLEGKIQNYTMEKRYIHKLGHTVWANITVSLRRNTLGTPRYLISAIEDINARKDTEFFLQAQAIELAETTALVKLRNQELDRFSYIVSHDLKAPLRAISNLSGWIQEDLSETDDSDIQKNLELMKSRVSRMEKMIDSLLRYARLGRSDANIETFSIEDLLIEIVDSLDIPSSFKVNLPSISSPITTDRVLLSQVLTNLISNAYKHHHRADGNIQVTAQAHAEVWELSVGDDGPGIALEDHDRVFEIFQTLSSSDEKNTGIGLSIVQRIVKAQGGDITIESQLGVGTTFRLIWKMVPDPLIPDPHN